MRTFDIVSTSIFSPPKTCPAVAYRPSQAQDDESLMYKLSLQNIRALSPKMLSRDAVFQAEPGPQTTSSNHVLCGAPEMHMAIYPYNLQYSLNCFYVNKFADHHCT